MIAALSEFHFLRPLCLALLLPFAMLLWRLWRSRRTHGVWESICDPALLPHLIIRRPGSTNRLSLFLFSVGGLIAILALAGPTWERLPTPVFRDESAMVVLLDLSRSMDANDIKPSRLERAKFKLTDIIRQRPEGQTALVVYAGEPYVVTPLTSDVATIEAQLPALQTTIMPNQGSIPSRAIAKGIDLLRQAGMARGELLLITDGLTDDELKQARRIIRKGELRLSVLGVGTTEGAPIPDRRGGFVKDERGSIVLEPLRAERLRDLASAGHGLYQTLRTDDKDAENLLALMAAERDQRESEITDLFADQWREFGPWLLAALLPIAPLAFRRGVLSLGMALVVSSVLPWQPAAAAWWQTPDQEAQLQFNEGEFADAAQTFADPDWAASAHYRAGNYDAAAAVLRDAADPQSQYNRGNALARLGQYEEAIAAYENTLSQHADHADALHNKALLEELLKDQQSQQQEQDSEPSDDGEQGESGQGGQNQAESSSDADTDATDANASQGDDSDKATTSADNSESQPETTQSPASEPSTTDDSNDGKQASANEARSEAQSDAETDQATEQWLRQIPDDPGGLLRRKFEYEYQVKHRDAERRPQGW